MNKSGNTDIKLNFGDGYTGTIFAVQGDTGRSLTVQILDQDNNIIDITGYELDFYIGFPKEKEVTKVSGDIISAQEGKFRVDIVNTQLKYPGIHKAQFVLKKDNKKIGTQIIDIEIEESIENGAIIGQNVIVDYERITEAITLLEAYDLTIAEAEDLDMRLKVKIEVGEGLADNLDTNTKAAAEASDVIDTKVKAAGTAKNNLDKSINTGNTLDTSLESNITAGTEINNTLNSNVSTAKTTSKTLVDNTSAAKTTNSNLTNTNTTASKTLGSLNKAIESGNTANSNLKSTTKSANNANTTLSETVNNAGTIESRMKKLNTLLESTIGTAETTNTTLSATNTEAVGTEQLIRDLLDQLNITKKDVEEIIAQGNLSQYVTDVSLQNKLESYVTTEEMNAAIEALDVSEQLVDYAKTAEVNKKLEPYAKTTDINAKLDKKVDKETGKGLSDENYTLPEKNKLKGIETNANNYKHPATHSASMITETNTRKWVSPSEKEKWNSKADKDTTYSNATTSKAGLMSSADKVKLDGVETGAQKNTITSVQGRTGAVTISKADVGLGDVNNVAITAAQVTKINELNYTRAMTQAQYDALSTSEKNRTDVWYGIYRE